MSETLAAEQTRHLKRVVTRFTPMMLSWLRDRLAIGQPHFHMFELTMFVARHYPTAPDSVGRTLRYLRKSGQIDYVVTERSESLYEVRFVKEAS